jgi:thiosulfate dehydrogenase [quinone] large subunit
VGRPRRTRPRPNPEARSSPSPVVPRQAGEQAGGRKIAPRDPASSFPWIPARVPRGLLPAVALLPLRAFLGITFLYAGLDKLLTPSFLHEGSSGSIYSQLQAFTRVSPIAGVIEPFLPYAGLVGLLIALAEIAIGLGALSGLLFRFAAAGGAALSLLFWLTASWATHPYYYGPDLPYALGWATLALAGTGEVLLLWPWLLGRLGVASGSTTEATFESRRVLLQAGLLAAASIVLAAMTPLVRSLVGGADDASAVGSTGGTAGGAASAGATTPAATQAAPGASPSAAAGAGGAASSAASMQIATVSQVDQNTAVDFTVPTSNNPNIPSGDPGIVVKLADGKYVAYDGVCTHAGCTVGYDPQYKLLVCPCHGAAFDPAKGAEVVAGPAPSPLYSLPIQVDRATGAITLKA